MLEYLARAPILISVGAVVSLTTEQAMRRIGRVEELPDGTFAVTKPFEMKAGEVFGYEGDLPKVLAEHARPADPGAPEGDGALKPPKADEGGSDDDSVRDDE